MCYTRHAVVKSSAVFSDDDLHRFILTRVWDEAKKRATIIMMNPSYADEIKSDLSVLKVMNFLVDQDYGSLNVINLFSYIATDPSNLVNNSDLVREETDDYIRKALDEADEVIIAWGSDKKKYVRRKRDLKCILEQRSNDKLFCFKDEEGRMGRHPSRLGNDLKLIEFIWD